jgi:tetratricopeptide (TPR) repeat protein
MKNRSYTLLILLVAALLSGLQETAYAKMRDAKADSIRHEYDNAKTDSAKIKWLDALITEIRFTEPSEAYVDAKHLLELALSEGKKGKIASAYNALSIVGRQIGDYDKAIGFAYKSLGLYEELKDTTSIAGCYLNLATIFKTKTDFTKALTLLNQGLDNFRKVKNKRGIAYCYNNIATIYQEQKKFAPALDYFRKACALKIEIGETRTLGSTYLNLGIIMKDLKQADSALVYYHRARMFCLKYENKECLCDVYANMGDLEREQKNYKYAAVLLDSAFLLAKELKVPESMEAVEKSLYQLNKAAGNPEQALIHFERYLISKDSTLNESSSKQIAGMGARYESDKKDKNIQLLRKQGEIALVQDKKQQVFIWGLIAGIAGVILLAVLLYSRVRFRERLNGQLSLVNVQINEQKKEITDSIQYARRIQESILLKPDKVLEILPQSFLLYRPKQIVSGDFYWIHRNKEEVIVAIIDNMLHGVPGAFISLVGINLLNRAIQENPSRNLQEMVRYINTGIVKSLNEMKGTDHYSEKMNYAICRVNTLTKSMECITTDNAIYIIGKNGARELKKGDQQEPVVHSVVLAADEMVCLFTDGYADQLGGKDGKKFMMRNLEEVLVSSSQLSLPQQKEKLETILNNWKERYEQVDDILLLGFRI